MDLVQQIKPEIADFHIDWLSSHFRVCRSFEYEYPEALPPLLTIRPDLIALTAPPTLLELKSRSYFGSQLKCQHYWWSCMVSQVRGYDEVVDKSNLAHAWLFLLVKADQRLSTLLASGGQIQESNILNRELFVASHGIESVASNYENPSGYYHISEPRLADDGFIKSEPNPRLTLFLQPNLEPGLIDCFVYR